MIVHVKNFSIPTSSFIAAFRLILQRLIGWFAISRRELPNPVLASAQRFRSLDKSSFNQQISMRCCRDRRCNTCLAAGQPERPWYPPNNIYVQRRPPEKTPYLRAQNSILQRLTAGLQDAGIPLLAGTDPFVPWVIPGFSIKDELEQLYEAGLSNYEALQSATSNPARFLNISREVGTVSKGEIADLGFAQCESAGKYR